MYLSRRVTRSRFAAGCRLFGSVLALAAMLAQVGGYVHLAFARHVTCAEHGELIEAGHAPATATAATSASAHRAYLANSDGATHGHDHCLVAPQRRDRAALTVTRAVVATTPLSLVARTVEAIGPPRAIALILLAPKNSPPV